MRQVIQCILAGVLFGAAAGCTTFTRNADAGADGTQSEADAQGADGTADAGADAAPDVVADGGADGQDVAPQPDGGDALLDVDDGADVGPTPDVPDPDVLGDAHDAAETGPDTPDVPDASIDVVDPCPAEPCVTPGLRVCTPDAIPVVLVCGEGQDGCLTWLVETACEPGQLCRSGVCGVDECPASGSLACSLDSLAYTICAAAEDGFLTWGPQQACPAGNVCKGNGQCGKDACPHAGMSACYGVSQSITCEADAAGFLSWSAPSPCGGAAVCKGGACGEDECSFAGQVTCIDDGHVSVCEQGDGGFLRWGDPLVCEGLCEPDAGCGDVCTPGAKQCSGASSTVTCLDLAGEPAWSNPSPCPPGQVCKGAGSCGSNQCLVEGTKVCSTVEGNQTLVCVLEPSGFMKWAPAGTCELGQVCKGAGVCGKDACVAGQAECIDGTAIRVCELGSAGFLEWSAPFACPAGSFCLGSVGCVPDGPVQVNADPLLEVSRPAAGALPGGGAVIAWTRTVAATSVVVTRTVDAAANPLGAEQAVTSLDGVTNQDEAAVAGSPDGRYVVAWTSMDQGSAVRAVVLGGASAGPTAVSAPGGENRRPAVGALPGGGYLVVWESTGAKCTGERCLLQRRLGPDGSPVTEVALAFDPGGKEQALHPALAVTPNGGAWVVGRRLTAQPAVCVGDCLEPPCCQETGVVQALAAVGLAPDGSLTVPPVTLDSTALSGLGDPSVAPSPATGAARAVWVGDLSSLANGVRFACLESQVGDACATQIVSKGGGSEPVGAAVAPQGDGSFVVAWAARPGAGPDRAVYTRRVATDGAVLTDPSQASLGLPGSHQHPALVRRTDGVVAVAWEAHDGGKHAIRYRIVKP
ncbi:MAG: hypothetical protein AMXMBFR64_18100 [Myxococcales bacterium]